MKKKLLILLSTMAFGICILFLLFICTDVSDKPTKDMSFSRVFVENPIKKERAVSITYNSYYIAGNTKNRIFLGNVTGFLHVLSANANLTDTTHHKIDLAKELASFEFKSPRVKILRPYFYLTDGVLPGIFRGKLNGWTARKFMPDSAYFSLVEPVSSSSFVIRTTQASTGEYVLGKLFSEPPYLKLQENLLEKQLDGVFDVDGSLQYNYELKKIVYTYYYRNSFLVSDPDLHSFYRGRTIDTFSHTLIKPVSVSSGSTKMLASPPKLINPISCVKGNFLFVNSRIMGKNDDLERFSQASVIDVYTLVDGSYCFSFYLPSYKGNAAVDFRIVQGRLIALYTRNLISYVLNPKLFSRTDLEGKL